jgi:two-component system NtrC family sensor kinase
MQPQKHNQSSLNSSANSVGDAINSQSTSRSHVGCLASPFVTLGTQFRNFSIRNKIRCGYALALSIAVGGTIIGLMAGNYYYQISAQQVDIDEESRRLKELQLTLLQTQIYQHRLIYLLKQPTFFDAQYNQLKEHTEKLKKLLPELQSELDNSEVEGFNIFMENYTQTLEIYIKNLEQIVNQIADFKNRKLEINATEKLLVDFANEQIRC